MRLYMLIICCICLFHSYSEGASGGLLFTSTAEKVDKRTSLVLFGDKLKKFEDSFSLSFDLSIWDIKQFGHIFRVINDKRQEVEFVFVNFYEINNMYLDFHSPITHKSVQIPIREENIDKKEILHFDIFFDLENDMASIAYKDSVYVCTPIGLENPSSLKIAFGLYQLNLDVPQMLIRNLRIESKKGKSYYFPLKESKGEYAYDETRKMKALVKNPQWIINNHFYWQQKSSFKMKNKAYVAYDENNNKIVTLTNDSIFSYNPRYGNTDKHKLNLPSRFQINDAIFNPYSIQYAILGTEVEEAPRLETMSNDLPINFFNSGDQKSLLHHNTFISSDGTLYQFGGYYNHTYSNEVFSYNNIEHRWDHVNFSGDKIMPRFYAAVGEGVHPDEKLIFGGFGNETGKQEHVGHNLYDLYLLNLKNKSIVNLWKFKEIPEIEFVPGSNLILSEDKSSFYSLCYAHHIPRTIGHLYRFDIESGSYEIMSDSISFNSEDMNSSVNLYYNKQLKEFYAVVRDFSDDGKTKIDIYSLLAPPINKSELESFTPIRSLTLTLLVIAVALMLVFVRLRFLFKSKKKWKQRKNNFSHLSKEIVSYKEKVKQSAIYLFGDFTAFDKNGIDISYRFSLKLRSLFSLILLHTKDETGISTDQLTMALWPDKDTIEAKNIRGVTVHRLRDILLDIEGISLVHQNSQWFFVFNESFYCDFTEYSSLLLLQNHSEDTYDDLMMRLIAVISRGSFLNNIQDNEIDNLKSDENDRIKSILREHILNLFSERQYQKLISFTASYLVLDPLNEEVLKIYEKSYNKIRKNKEA